VGLLTAPLSLVREPLRLTLRAWAFGLATAAEGARIAGALLDPDRGEPPPDVAEPWSPPQPTEQDNGRRSYTGAPDVPPPVPDVPPPVPDAPPAVPDELVPDHVDEEPVLVAEVAEEGAAEGAGAELHVDAPWEGYDQMTAADICDRLAAATPAQAAAVELYEASGKKRRTVLDQAERALRGN
jgi:hypothetical protein